jgi:hypothetical protein
MTAFLADVVAPQQLNSAMGMMQTLSLPAMIGGQALGALLLDRVPLPVLFGIDGATYVVYAAALAFTIPVAAAAPTPTLQESDRRLRPHLGARLYADLRAAADYIWHRPGMRFILLAAIPVSILTETLLVFLPVYATNALQVVLSHYPYLTASYSVGLLAGYSAVAREIIPSVRRSSIVTGCILASAAICMGLALTRSYWTALPLLLLFGVCTGSIFLLSLNALLAQTDPDMRGRVSAVLLMITQGLTPLAMSGLGIAVDQLAGNVRPVYGACSLAFGLLGLLFACSRMLQYFFSRPRSRPT